MRAATRRFCRFLPLLTLLPASVLAEAEAPSTRLSRAVDLIHRLAEQAPTLDRDVLHHALRATDCARQAGHEASARRLTVIDYSLPSTERRLWVFDLVSGDLLHHELVAHGRGTGENMATRFSNRPGSKQTSLGLYVTQETYQGGNGYSLRLRGLEPGVNDKARDRAIVMHGAWYVSDDFAREHGRLGRSWGCPALDDAVARRVIDDIRDGTLLFSYYPDAAWLEASPYLRGCAGEASNPPLGTD